MPPPGGFAAVGGLDGVKQQLRETVLLPLTYPGLYEQLGIKAPRWVCGWVLEKRMKAEERD